MYTVTCRFAPGQAVTIVPLAVRGTVWQVMVAEGSVCYDCFWWWNGERKSSVLTEGELSEVARVPRAGLSAVGPV